MFTSEDFLKALDGDIQADIKMGINSNTAQFNEICVLRRKKVNGSSLFITRTGSLSKIETGGKWSRPNKWSRPKTLIGNDKNYSNAVVIKKPLAVYLFDDNSSLPDGQWACEHLMKLGFGPYVFEKSVQDFLKIGRFNEKLLTKIEPAATWSVFGGDESNILFENENLKKTTQEEQSNRSLIHGSW